MDTSEISNRPWVLLSGTLCTCAVFDGLLDALGVDHAQRRCIPLDRPSIEDYQATLEAISEEAIVCGFSLGAIVAAHFADRMIAHRLVLFGINPFADDPSKAQGRLDLADDVNNRGGAIALTARAPEVFGPTPEKSRALIYQMAEATSLMIDAQTQLALKRPGALSALENARMPVLSLTGTRDQSAPTAHGKAAAQAAPNGQFHDLDGLGHYALVEDPTICAAALAKLMEPRHDTH